METSTEAEMLLNQQKQLRLAKLQEAHSIWRNAEHTKIILKALKKLYESRVSDAESHCDKNTDSVRILLTEARSIKDIIAKLDSTEFIIKFGDSN